MSTDIESPAFVTVVTGAAAIGDDVVSTLTDAFGVSASDARRLGATAAEFALSRETPRADALKMRDAARSRMEGASVDINLVAADGRRKSILIADMDSTIITVECVDELADFAGVKDRVAAITERAMRGELDFEEALLERVGLLKGLPEAMLHECYHQRVALTPGAERLVRTMRAHGALTALVSGGFTFFTERVAERAGFMRNQANRLLVENGALTGDVSRPILGREAKLAALREFAAELDVSTDDALAVGDGANDLAMIGAAGLGVAFRAKPAVAAAADAAIQHGDLTALLYLQGYKDEEMTEA